MSHCPTAATHRSTRLPLAQGAVKWAATGTPERKMASSGRLARGSERKSGSSGRLGAQKWLEWTTGESTRRRFALRGIHSTVICAPREPGRIHSTPICAPRRSLITRPRLAGKPCLYVSPRTNMPQSPSNKSAWHLHASEVDREVVFTKSTSVSVSKYIVLRPFTSKNEKK